MLHKEDNSIGSYDDDDNDDDDHVVLADNCCNEFYKQIVFEFDVNYFCLLSS